jgi:hypothetical protein
LEENKLIEIGRDSKVSLATRRIAGTLAGVSMLLGLIWLIRGLIGLQPYSVSLLLAAFGLFFVGRVFRAETKSGAGRAIVSLLWNFLAAFVGIILTIWIFGWVASLQSDVFPTTVSRWVPDLAVAAITAGLGAYALQKLGLARRWGVPPFLVAEGKGPTMEGTRLTVKHDTVGMPINREGRTIGCVLLGEVSTSFKTPMGMVSASLPGPVTTVGVPFQGRKATDDEVVKMTGKSQNQLSIETASRADDLDVGRIRLRDGCMGDRWKVGPLIFDWDGDGEHHPKERWLAKGTGSNAYVTTNGHRSTAKWNGSSLVVGDGSMELSAGSDSFSYSPTEVRTASPLHTLQVTQDKIMLDIRKFTLKVSGDTVILRTEEKTSRTESKVLANDLRSLLTETAKKHVRDVMEGNPIDFGEMLTTTEEALAKYD